MYLIYVDDSGDEQRTLLSALCIPEHRWSSSLRSWLTFRKQLFRDHQIPAGYELHAQDWLSKTPAQLDDGSGTPPAILAQARAARRERFQRYEAALKVIGSFADARLLTVYTTGTDKFGLYAELLAWIEELLRTESSYGAIVLDGLDQGGHYRRRHRDLPIKTRRILEDPMECPSHGSQLIQMADCCVHAAFRHVRRSSTDDPKLLAAYPNALTRIIEPGSGGEAGIRGWPEPE